MTEAAIIQQLTDTLPDVQVVPGDGAFFLFVGPERMFPFATIVTSDAHDQASDLDREGVFRLNVGVSRETFRRLFPEEATWDFTARDRLMPHPVYGGMHWVCVLSPSAATFETTMRPLLAEAYELAAGRQARHAAAE